MIQSTASGAVSAASSAAAAMAGALLRPTGSSRMRALAIPASRSCSATTKRWSWLATTMGGLNSAEAARRAVSASIECSAISGQNCLGKLLRETGQSLVPEPPERMTGMILSAGASLFMISSVMPDRN